METYDLTLAEVDKAIHKVLVGGQSITLGGRQITRATISHLMELRRQIAGEEAVEQDDPRAFPNTTVAVFDRR